MIKIKKLTHSYGKGNVLENVNININKGESVVMLGSSGSGKSTLLYSINRLIDPTSGQVFIDGKDILALNGWPLKKMRQGIGMIFQEFGLVNSSSAMANVLCGRLSYVTTINSTFNRFSNKDKEIALKCLERVGMLKYANKKVSNLSGGERQRVGIARALAQEPKILLADEPVSSLDPKLMVEIMDLIKGVCKERDMTLVCSLHFIELAKKYAKRFIGLKDGRVAFDGRLTQKNIIKIYGETKEFELYGKKKFG